MSKSKKKNKKFQKPSEVPKKKNNALKIIILIACAAVIAAAVLLIILLPKNNAAQQLTDKTWTSQKAYTASGDEADMLAVYNVNYTAYQGSLTFNSDGSFELWLSPGDPDDGTHKGTYELSEDKISVTLDSGEEGEFTPEYSSDGRINSIAVPYSNGYEDFTVYFYPPAD